MPKTPKYLLEFIIFTSGAVIMIMELTGTRILSPYLGNSTFIWTSLIGIILGSLSLGYYLGGKFADKNPSNQGLSLILFISAILIAFTTQFSTVILEIIERNFTDIRVASIIATLLLFAPQSVFLGMVSPYAIRLKITNIKNSGATVGRLYAISTIGSIVGTFLAGFYLLAFFGSVQLMVILAITLTITSALLSRKYLLSLQCIFLILLGVILFNINLVQAENLKNNFIDVDTEYSRVQIFDHNNIRYMEIGNNQSSAMNLNSDELVYEYTKTYDLAKTFKPNFKNSLLLGGGAFSYAKHYLNEYPHANLDVVEIDPALTELSEKYFRLNPNHPRLNIYNEDGRTYLNKNTTKYDIIFGDAFKSFYSIPHQLTTLEAVQKHYDSLTEDGIVILNIAGSIEGETGQFFRAELRTYQEIFPQVLTFTTREHNPNTLQNIIIIAFKKPMKVPENLENLWTKEIHLDMPILTDNFAPVDQYMMVLYDYIKL